MSDNKTYRPRDGRGRGRGPMLGLGPKNGSGPRGGTEQCIRYKKKE